jgi:hypothetical protein
MEEGAAAAAPHPRPPLIEAPPAVPNGPGIQPGPFRCRDRRAEFDLEVITLTLLERTMRDLRRRLRFVQLLWVVLGLAGPAAAQVDAETLLDESGYGVARIHNASGDVVDVDVELRHGSVTRDSVSLRARLDGLVTPSRFHLAPGETQTIRILVRERLAPGSVARLVTTLTPRAAVARSDTATGAEARLIFATRLITKVRAR